MGRGRASELAVCTRVQRGGQTFTESAQRPSVGRKDTQSDSPLLSVKLALNAKDTLSHLIFDDKLN